MGGCIDVAIDATKCRYCKVKKKSRSVLDCRQALPNQYKETFSYEGWITQTAGTAPCPEVLFALPAVVSEDAEQVFQN